MEKVFIVSAKRTAIGSFLGSLQNESPIAMGKTVVERILAECPIDPANIDEVIVGNVLPAGHGQNIARQISIGAGIPDTVPAYSINMLCDSGMKATLNAFSSIRAGDAKVVLAGGAESMSMSPYLLPYTYRSGAKLGDVTASDYLIENLTDSFNNYHMGVTAENIAEMFGIDREAQDAYALRSQERAIRAVDVGRFDDEIVPYTIKSRRGDTVLTRDEYPNRETSLEKLAALRPAFSRDGSVTAGNASGLNDAASFTLIASESACKEYGLLPLAEIVAVAQSGLDPKIMGLGPVNAIAKALKKADMSLTDMDLLELNEAFAAQVLGVNHQLREQHGVSDEWLSERTNVNGGAIALGHPIGASGNRIIVSLLHEMQKRQSTFGVASLCAGGGMGTAVILKNLQV